MSRLAIVNLNLDPAELAGCRQIAAALSTLTGAPPPPIHPFAAVRADPTALATAGAVVLGPQGTPFSAYDAGWLPALRALVEGSDRPVLGICGGMQALALAWGGRLGTVYGEAVGADYTANRKLRGPLEIRLDAAALPAWLPAAARDRLAGWPHLGGLAFESHVEQVSELPAAFVAVARSEPTPVEAFAHRDKPILACQFHPELGWDEGCGAGRAWLEAFVALVASGR